MATQAATWRDIDVTFEKNLVTNDVSTVTDVQSILQHIKMLLSTEAFDIPFHPEIACGLPFFEFELFGAQVQDAANFAVQTLLQAFEPRVTLKTLDIELQADQNAFSVKGVVQVISTGLLLPFTTILQRYR